MNIAKSVVKKFYFVFMTLLFLQLPCFVDQYMMHVEGHLKESSLVISKMQKTATEAGFLTLDAYAHFFSDNSNKSIQSHGAFLGDLIHRNEYLKRVYAHLTDANPFIRPFLFFVYGDREIIGETWHSFAPGLLVTQVAFIWAAVGALVAYLLFRAVSRLVSKPSK